MWLTNHLCWFYGKFSWINAGYTVNNIVKITAAEFTITHKKPIPPLHLVRQQCQNYNMMQL